MDGIGINGMGRIGRLLVRKAFSEGSRIGIKAINIIHPLETIAHLMKYDSIHGFWDAIIECRHEELIINGYAIKVFYEYQPDKIPWSKAGIDTVIDATGKFNDREGAMRHLKLGTVSTVIITAPAKNLDLTVVMGVNDHQYDPNKHILLSSASCTTNCVVPVLDILDRAFHIEQGWMTTIHSYTNDQNHLDNPHQDLRRARGCTQSIVPTTTGIGKALMEVLPHLANAIHGLSIRVPTPDVSLIDLTVQVEKKATIEKVRTEFSKAMEGRMAPIVGYTEEPLVSADFIGSSKSAVIDGLALMVSQNQIKVLAWYDNEWAYTCRVMELAQKVKEMKIERMRITC